MLSKEKNSVNPLKWFLLFCLGGFCITGCSVDYVPDPTQYDLLHIKGQVVDIDGNPIPDISFGLSTRDTLRNFLFFYSYDTTEVRRTLSDNNGYVDLLVDRQELTRSFLYCNHDLENSQSEYSTSIIIFDTEELMQDHIDVVVDLKPSAKLTVINNTSHDGNYYISGDHIQNIEGEPECRVHQYLNIGKSAIHNLSLGQKVNLSYSSTHSVDTSFILSETNMTYEIN